MTEHEPRPELHAEVTGNGSIYQAGRDQHIHYQTGVRCRRRTEADARTDACPYPGLISFGPEHARWFFGRDRTVASLIARVDDQLHVGSPLAVVAPSGAGKSSLLAAGLLPDLRDGALEGSRHWSQMLFTPTACPLASLTNALAVGPRADSSGATAAIIDPDQFADMCRSNQRRVIVVDQLEELFTQCHDDRERHRFLDVLARLAVSEPTRGKAGAVVIYGLRADFYARAVEYPQLRAVLQEGQVLLGPMSEEELRETILFPAEDVGLQCEPGLVELLLADLGVTAHHSSYEPGRLPLLAHALRTSWQQRHGHLLTVSGYQNTGGIRGAVAATAERVFMSLDSVGQRIARTMFLRLTTIGEGTDDSRRRVPRSIVIEESSAPSAASTVLDAFTRARLLTQQQTHVEITHDALLRAWPRLRDWLDTDRAANLLRQQLEDAAIAWNDNRSDTASMFRGSRLETVRAWAATHSPSDLSATGRQFLSASIRLHRRSNLRRRAAIALLTVLSMVASVTAILAVRNGGNASQQHAIALSRQLIADSVSVGPTEPILARQLAAAAWTVSHTDQAAATVTDLLAEQQQDSMLPADLDGVTAVVFSPDGRVLACGNFDGTVRFWNPTNGQAIGPPLSADPGGAVNAVAFSPNGQIFASADSDGTIRLWNPTTRQPVHTPLSAVPEDPLADATSLTFSPDGKTLLSADRNGAIHFWNATTGQAIGPPLPADPGGTVNAIAFSPNGQIFASADSDGTIRLWNPTTRQPVEAPLRTDAGSPGDEAKSVAFSPNGQVLAGEGENGAVWLWDPRTGQPIGSPLPTDPGGSISALAFSPNGQTLATARGTDPVQLWNVTSRQPIATPLNTSLPFGVVAIAFSPNGQMLATANVDGTVQLWNPATRRLIEAPISPPPGTSFTSATFSPNSQILASGDSDGTVRMWNPNTGQPIGTPLSTGSDSQRGVLTEAFSPNGRILADGGGDGAIHLWNLTVRQPVATLLGAPEPAPGSQVQSVAFSPNGQILASGKADGTIRMWNPTTGQPIGTPLQTDSVDSGGVFDVTFSPDGQILASADGDETIRLWNPTTGRLIRIISAPVTSQEVGVHAVAFSPNDQVLASGNADGTIRMWNPTTGQPIGKPSLTGLPSSLPDVPSIAFSPNGQMLASADHDGTIRLWNPANGELITTPLPASWFDKEVGLAEVVFSPNGEMLASVDSAVGTLFRWRPAVFFDPGAALCNDVGLPTLPEWNTYAPGEPEPSRCS